jgi:hypothetical protein
MHHLRNGGYLIMGHEVKHVLYTYFRKNLKSVGGESTLYLGNMVCSKHVILQKCL